MSVQNYVCRLFGGRDIGVSYDNGAGTLAILGQSLTISTLSAALQARWSAAVGSAGINTGARGAFSGDNVTSAVGDILDNQPAWRNSVQAALSGFVAEQTLAGQVAGVDTFNR